MPGASGKACYVASRQLIALFYRHFLKEDLPRIRYVNPKLDISVEKKPHTKDDKWAPELVLEFSALSVLFRLRVAHFPARSQWPRRET